MSSPERTGLVKKRTENGITGLKRGWEARKKFLTSSKERGKINEFLARANGLNEGAGAEKFRKKYLTSETRCAKI